MLLKSLSS
jgi:hypothetical protein